MTASSIMPTGSRNDAEEVLCRDPERVRLALAGIDGDALAQRLLLAEPGEQLLTTSMRFEPTPLASPSFVTQDEEPNTTMRGVSLVTPAWAVSRGAPGRPPPVGEATAMVWFSRVMAFEQGFAVPHRGDHGGRVAVEYRLDAETANPGRTRSTKRRSTTLSPPLSAVSSTVRTLSEREDASARVASEEAEGRADEVDDWGALR